MPTVTINTPPTFGGETYPNIATEILRRIDAAEQARAPEHPREWPYRVLIPAWLEHKPIAYLILAVRTAGYHPPSRPGWTSLSRARFRTGRSRRLEVHYTFYVGGSTP